MRSPSAAVLCAAALLLGTPLRGSAAAGSIAGSDDASDDSNADVYLAAGAALLVGSLILLDILSEDGQEPVGELQQTAQPLLVPTGVDWAAVETALDEEIPVIAVSIRSEDLAGPGGALLDALRADAGDEVEVLPDLLDLGASGGAEAFGMASTFFGATALVSVSGTPDHPQLELSTQSGPIWSGPAGPDPAADALVLLAALRNSLP